jgi:hypothetical protein
MSRSSILSTVVIFSLLFQFAVPHNVWGGFFDFDDPVDSLKTTGIIIGITAGVVLLVVLIAGTIKDIKGGDEEEVDIWADLRQDRSLGQAYGFLIAPVFLGVPDCDATRPGTPIGGVPERMLSRHDRGEPAHGLNQELFLIGGSATAFSAPGIVPEPEGSARSVSPVRPL